MMASLNIMGPNQMGVEQESLRPENLDFAILRMFFSCLLGTILDHLRSLIIHISTATESISHLGAGQESYANNRENLSESS